MAANNTKPLQNAQKAPNYDFAYAAYLVAISRIKLPPSFYTSRDPNALRRLAEQVAPGALDRAANAPMDDTLRETANACLRVLFACRPGPNGSYTFGGHVVDFHDPAFFVKRGFPVGPSDVKQVLDLWQRPEIQSSSSSAVHQPLQRTASAQAAPTVHTTPTPRPSPQNTISLEEHPTPSHNFPATQASQKTINHPRDDDADEERPAKRARHQAPDAVVAPSPNPRRPQAHSATKPRTPPVKPRRAHPPQRPIPSQPPHHANPNNNAGMMPAHAGPAPYPSPPQADLPPHGPFFDPRCPDHVYFVHPQDGRRHWVPRNALPPAQRHIPHPSQAGGPSVQRPAVVNRLAAGPRAQLPTPPLTVSPAESYTANPQPPITSVSNSNAAPTPTAPPRLIPCRWGFCTHTFSTDQTPASIGMHLKTVHSIHPEEVPPDVRRKRGRQAADGKQYICHWITKDGHECRNPLGKDGPDVGPIARHVRGQHLEKDTREELVPKVQSDHRRGQPTATAGDSGRGMSATHYSPTCHDSAHLVARMLLAEFVLASTYAQLGPRLASIWKTCLAPPRRVRLAFPGALVLNHSGVPRRTPLQGLESAGLRWSAHDRRDGAHRSEGHLRFVFAGIGMQAAGIHSARRAG
ncbi:uncharacterized protein SCHCODRAFT_02534762 [Schizophyllum commune H4-8]